MEETDELQKKYFKQVFQIFPSAIVDMIGKERFLKACPVEWQQKWLGSTGYIDSTCPSDFPDNNSIYYGTDCYKRPFIFLKIKCTKNKEEKYGSLQDYIMINIFRRYTDRDLYVVCSRREEAETLLKHRCAITNDFASDISNFLENKYVEREASEYQSHVRLEIL